MALADRMIQYRAKERMTQVDFAEKVGVSVQTICAVETGAQNPSKITKAKIELVIGKEDD